MKTEIGAVNALPTITTLVGANVNGKPNYVAIAWVGTIGRNNLSVCINKQHFTNAGIKENQTFSVNLPSENLVKETDYCGLKSGRDTDKSLMFKTFYGKLRTAPMIQECPVNMECKLTKTIDTPTHDVFVGEVVATYSEDSALIEKRINLGAVKPIFFSMNDLGYWKLGERLANAWEIGKNLK